MAPTTFYQFYSLPPELRLKIWTLSLTPRIIRIKRPLPAGFPHEFPDPPRQPLPTPFHVCQESRTEIRALYRPLISTIFKTAPGELVNQSIDTFSDDMIYRWITHRNDTDKIYDSGIINGWRHDTTEQYYADHSPLSLLSLGANFASSVTSLVLTAAGVKAVEAGSALLGPPLNEIKANNLMSKNMISVLGRFPALRELKLLLSQNIDFPLPGTDLSVKKFRPVRLCSLLKRCHDCCKMMPGLERIDLWTWRVKNQNGERWRGPTIRFVCFGSYRSNCSDEGHPEDCVHCTTDTQLRSLGDSAVPRAGWQETLDLLEV